MFQMSKLQKKITKFSIEGQSNIGETKSKDGFFPSLVLTLIKRLNGRRKKKDSWAKRPRKGLLLDFFFGLFFVDLALKGMFL